MRWVDFDEAAAQTAAAVLRDRAEDVQRAASRLEQAVGIRWDGAAQREVTTDAADLATELRRAAREMYDSASIIDGAVRQARTLDTERAEADRRRRAQAAERATARERSSQSRRDPRPRRWS